MHGVGWAREVPPLEAPAAREMPEAPAARPRLPHAADASSRARYPARHASVAATLLNV